MIVAPIDWPEEITPALAEILGRPNFMCGSIAQIYRRAGFDIPNKAEAEQAFVLHRFVKIWAEHGDGWANAAAQDMQLHAEKAVSRG